MRRHSYTLVVFIGRQINGNKTKASGHPFTVFVLLKLWRIQTNRSNSALVDDANDLQYFPSRKSEQIRRNANEKIRTRILRGHSVTIRFARFRLGHAKVFGNVCFGYIDEQLPYTLRSGDRSAPFKTLTDRNMCFRLDREKAHLK